VLACGVGAFGAGVFHLMTHAFFKALLFLGAGSVIHSLSGEQDMRKMGALSSKIPYTFWTFFFAWLAIIGTPGLAGFFSKDEILWRSFISPVGSGPLLYVVALITAGLTAFYMSRLVFMTFFGESRVEKHAAEHLHESPAVMTIPLMVLAVLSVFGGYLGVPAILGGSNFLEHWLEPVMGKGAEIIAEHAGHGEHSHALEYGLMGLSVAVAGVGVFLAYYFYLQNKSAADSIAEKFSGLHRTLENKYYVDELYNAVFVRGMVMNGGEALSKFDAKVVDGGVNGAAWLTRLTSTASMWWDKWIVDGLVRLTAFVVQVPLSISAAVLQTGKVQLYALSILTGLLIFFSYHLFR
jgi:NADH-quinone oxidoreductase subunit L